MSFIATAIIGGGALSAGSSLFGAFEQAGAEQQAAGTILQGEQQGLGAIQGYLPQAVSGLQGYTQQGAGSLMGLLSPYLTYGTQAGGSLTDLLTGGPGGTFNQQALQNLPGYQFQLQQAQGAVNNAATTSGLGGNVIQASENVASGLASSNYGQYAGLLQGLTNTGSGAATAGGVSLANLFGGAGTSLSSLYGQTGQNIANLIAGASGNVAQTQVGAGSAIAAGAAGAGGGVGSSITNALVLSKLLGGNKGASAPNT